MGLAESMAQKSVHLKSGLKGGTPVAGEAFASLVIFTRVTHGQGESLKERFSRMEERIPVEDLVVQGTASVTSSVNTKVSESEYYGKGTWDKVPYSVDVFSSVTLSCEQNEESIRAAQRVAYDLAWQASRSHIHEAIAGHAIDIRTRLYAGLFEEVGDGNS